jgi:succinate dehydrogenase/fumarate reductase flavoprotein subunit
MSGGEMGLPQFRWDHETDVVVVGFGYAGAFAAIAAHDAGVDVIILKSS